MVSRALKPMATREFIFRYFRIQTAGLFATWTMLLFLEWAKPHLVGNYFNPQWVLILLGISVIITTLLMPRQAADSAARWRYRRLVAIAAGVIALVSVRAAVSSPVGWIFAVVAWGSVLSAVTPKDRENV